MALSSVESAEQCDESTKIILRTYQQEMFERSLEGNTIVVMETGSGKTAVATARIQHALNTFKENKIVWFLTEGVSLCRQQHAVVQRQIPSAISRLVVGEDGPELWGSQEVWKRVLQGVNIVFSTFEVLHSALGHAYVRMSDIGLLIFDEAHHVTKNHPSNQIMKKFYFPLRERSEGCSGPMILGLTASPAENGAEQKLKGLESNLAAICRTPRANRLELQRHVHRPVLEKLTYSQDAHIQLAHMQMFEQTKLTESKNMRFKNALASVLRSIEHLTEELGLWAAWTFVTELILKLEEKLQRESLNFMPCSKLYKRDLQNALKPLSRSLAAAHASHARFSNSQIHLSAKVLCLIERLKKFREDQGSRLLGIVFVRRRITTVMLDRLLREHPEVPVDLKTGVFAGESNNVSFEKQIPELLVPRTQTETLFQFRHGQKNLLIATDALDEGIDVSACNTIICFDMPQNLRSFVQKRGRARQQGSTYTMMLPQQSSWEDVHHFEIIEDLMMQMVQQEERDVAHAFRQEAVEEEMHYSLSSVITGAILTADSTRAHLHHFCDKLPRVPYTTSAPTFACTEDETGFISAEVRLPLSVPSWIRVSKSAQLWRTERAAIKDAAFQAYQKLYHNGFLTENLLPKSNKPIFCEDFEDQRRLFHYLEESVCIWDEACSGKTIFRTSLVIRDSTSGWNSERLVLWTANDISAVGDLELVVEDGRHLVVELRSMGFSYLEEEDFSETLMPCTGTLVSAARSNLLSRTESRFVLFVTPNLPFAKLKEWSARFSGETPAYEYFDRDGDFGQELIANSAQGNRLYVLQRLKSFQNELGECLSELECCPFPRRRNFLKLRAGPASSLSEQGYDADDASSVFLDVDDCTVRRIPIKYAWTARYLPSIIYLLEMRLIAHSLRQDVLPQVFFGSLFELVSSLTCPATGLSDNYEILEFLGDTLLKFQASQQVFCNFPEWHEEYLTRQRNTLISNISLAKAAIVKGIDKYIIKDPFVGKDWKAPSLESVTRQKSAVRHLRMKTIADVVEALIGAAFMGGGMTSAKRCMSALLPGIVEEIDLGQYMSLYFSARDSDPAIHLKHAERVIGYSFKNKSLLKEALTHSSCQRDEHTESYQRLEFLGDAVLDYLVVSEVFSLLNHASQAHMTRIKAALVNGDFLAFLCYSCHDDVEGIRYTMSAEGCPQSELVKQPQGLWMMMRTESEAVRDAQHKGYERFQQYRSSIWNILEEGNFYPWEELCILQLPKFTSDIVESLLGAISLDCNGGLEAGRKFLQRIGLMSYLHRIAMGCVNVMHPRERLQRLSNGRKISLRWSKSANDIDVTLLMDEIPISHQENCSSKAEAMIKVTNAACKQLEARLCGRRAGT